MYQLSGVLWLVMGRAVASVYVLWSSPPPKPFVPCCHRGTEMKPDVLQFSDFISPPGFTDVESTIKSYKTSVK